MSESKIQEFYKDQTVFVTGGTGHVGLLLIRKLLTVCAVKRIIMLMRGKKGQTPEERLDFLLNKVLLKQADCRKKITLVKGDCSLPDLGISQEDWEMMTREVDSVINCSASINFSEPLRNATYVNVRSVVNVLKLCREIQNLKALVHVSTAYLNCNKKYIKEKFYDPPMTAKELLFLVESNDDETLEKETFNIICDWPNTYTFTKAIAENVIKEEGGHLPVAIVRLGAVAGSVEEPEPGWTNSIQLVGVMVSGVYTGFLHLLMFDSKHVSHLVPLDYTINNILAVGWYTAEKTEHSLIYNFTSCDKNVLTWGKYRQLAFDAANKYPYSKAIWMPFLLFTKNKYLFLLGNFCFHGLPAYLADCIFSDKKIRFYDLYLKLNKNIKHSFYFWINSWKFDNTNVKNLWNVMNEEDKAVFPFNMETLQWWKYMEHLILYKRVHTLKDPLESLPQAHRRNVILKILHYFTVLLLFVFGVGLIVLVLKFLS